VVLTAVKKVGLRDSLSATLASVLGSAPHLGMEWSREAPGVVVSLHSFAAVHALMQPDLAFSMKIGDTCGKEHARVTTQCRSHDLLYE